MALTVELDEELAAKLQQRANAKQVSVRDFAVSVLMDAVQLPLDFRSWKLVNARRLELIAMEYRQGLSAVEASELDALQAVAAKASEPEDRRLLSSLLDLEQRKSSTAGTPHE